MRGGSDVYGSKICLESVSDATIGLRVVENMRQQLVCIETKLFKNENVVDEI